MSMEVSFIATGDALMTRRVPEGGYPGLAKICEIIAKHDVRFSNLEITTHDHEGYPAAFSGGTWAMADPGILDDLRDRFYFNLFNTANNHSLDYEIAGLQATIRHLKSRGLLYAGTGDNLGDAGAPVYVETANARVAMIGVSATFFPSGAAGNQRIDMKGRPGLNPLRFSSTYHLDPMHYANLKALVEAYPKPANNEPNDSEPADIIKFGGQTFVLGEENCLHTEPNKKDMERILENIRDARRQADYVLLSLHVHAMEKGEVSEPAEFVKTFSHACIDAGAQAVLGHGPHVLRPIEVYNGGVIFYSLGNFIFQPDTSSHQPADAFESFSMSPYALVGDYMDTRAKDSSRSFFKNQEVWRAVMAGMTAKDGRIVQVQLYPIYLGMEMTRSRIGWPRLAEDNAVLEYQAELSARYGTVTRIENGIAYIDLI